MEDYFFETEERPEKRTLVLIAYDIISTRKRNKLVKFLQSYGFRIQKSVFEAMISDKLYNKLILEIGAYADEEDSIRVYKILGKSQVMNFGKEQEDLWETTIIV